MHDDVVVIGRIRRAHGTKGELMVEILTDFPERFAEMQRVLLMSPGAEEPPRSFMIDAARRHQRGVLIYLKGIATRTEAESLRECLVCVPREEAASLPEGEFYHFQLIGLEVVTVEGVRLGEVREVHRFPANDVYEVWDEERQREVLLPAIAEVVRDVDLARGVMTVELMEGLVD